MIIFFQDKTFIENNQIGFLIICKIFNYNFKKF